MSDDLISAVHQLTGVVQELQKTLEEDYPKRQELERDYLSVEQGKARRKQFIGFILLSVVIGYFATISTISYCFIDGAPAPGCQIVPGYAQSQQNKDTRFALFEQLLDTTAENQQRIEDLEKQVNGAPR